MAVSVCPFRQAWTSAVSPFFEDKRDQNKNQGGSSDGEIRTHVVLCVHVCSVVNKHERGVGMTVETGKHQRRASTLKEDRDTWQGNRIVRFLFTNRVARINISIVLHESCCFVDKTNFARKHQGCFSMLNRGMKITLKNCATEYAESYFALTSLSTEFARELLLGSRRLKAAMFCSQTPFPKTEEVFNAIEGIDEFVLVIDDFDVALHLKVPTYM
jgi:hypothetical protein